MSGGSHDYAYIKLVDVADSFYQEPEKIEHIELRKKLRDILTLCSKVAHDIEWIDSGDYGEDSWEEVKKDLDRVQITN